jgi:hypothetical protein
MLPANGVCSMRRLSWVWLVILGVPSGCTWVSPTERAAKVLLLDDDGDGVPNGEDCSPALASQGDHPEVPYDGIDNDCIDGDVVDRDRDGFPGISREAWLERVEQEGTGLSWPLDCTDDCPELDCDDEDRDIFPGAEEVFYDGVHTSCGSKDDFDADGDGYIPSTWAASPEYAAYVTRQGAEPSPSGDCDDDNASIHPGITEDAPYDGVDADCAFDNDFDQDGDGFVLEHATEAVDYWAAFQVYRARPGYEHLEASPGDCLDAPAVREGAVLLLTTGENCPRSEDLVDEQHVVEPTLVYPGACDRPYDGIDADCGADDDFDYDGDGFSDAGRIDALATYIDAWGYGDRLSLDLATDCRDIDAQAHPNATEILGDDIDQDCFEGSGFGNCGQLSGLGEVGDCVAALRTSDITWVGAGPPAIQGHDQGLALTLTADAAFQTSGTFSVETPSVFTLTLDPAARPVVPLDAASVPATWSLLQADEGLRPQVSSVLVGRDLGIAAFTEVAGGPSHLVVSRFGWDLSTTPAYASPLTDTQFELELPSAVPYDDMATWVSEAGRHWFAMCRSGELSVLTTAADWPQLPRITTVTPGDALCDGDPICASGTSCAFLGDPFGFSVVSCGPLGCESYAVSATGTNPPQLVRQSQRAWHQTVMAGDPPSPVALVEVHARPNPQQADPAALFFDATGGLHTYDNFFARAAVERVLSDWTIRELDAVQDGEVTYVAFIGWDGVRWDLFLAQLDLAREQEVIGSFGLPDALPGMEPTAVALHGEDGTLVVTASVEDGTGVQTVWAVYEY